MPLACARIVDAIAARLKGNGITPAGVRVYTSRAWPLADDQLPAWRVTAEDEVIEQANIQWPHLNTHTLTVELEGIVRRVSDLDDGLHQMAETALRRLFSDREAAHLGVLRAPITLSAIARRLGTLDEAAIGAVTITLTARFSTQADRPDTLI